MLYFFIKPVITVDSFEAELDKSDGDVRIFCQSVCQFKDELQKWCEITQKGQYLCDFEDTIGLILNDDLQIVEIKQILEKWDSVFGQLAVGVGTTKLCAYKAMCCAVHCSTHGLSFYSPEMDEKLASLSKAEGEQPAPQDQFHLDLPEFNVPEKKDEQKDTSALKNKILQTLQLMKEKSQVISQLKQTDPQAFAAVMKVVETLTVLAQNGLVKKEKLIGGLGDNAKDDEFDPEELKMGIAHEMEHTNDEAVAKEIAADHLSENPRYYTDLKNIEKAEGPEAPKAGDDNRKEQVQIQKPDGFGKQGFINPAQGKIKTIPKDQRTGAEGIAKEVRPLGGQAMDEEGAVKGITTRRSGSPAD
jgi:hypothetical protein